ncbi:unnamed protein product, partial [Symbiodinium sp. CCMP2456]
MGDLDASTVARLGTVAAALKAPALMQAAAEEASRRPSDFGNQEAAMIARALALSQHSSAVAALVEGAVPRATALGARALVRLAWAGAAVRLPGSELEPILNEASTRAERLQPK